MADGQAHQFNLYHDPQAGELSCVVEIPGTGYSAGLRLRGDGTHFVGEADQRAAESACEQHFQSDFRLVTADRMHVTVTAGAPGCEVPRDFRLEYDIVRSAP
jgi:hypothetical protein